MSYKMNPFRKAFLMLALSAALLVVGSGLVEIKFPAGILVSTAQAYLGRPTTPVSYAGVARRTTRRAVTPGVGAPGVGVAPGVGAGGVGGPASGVGVLPGAGAGQAGVGYSGGAGVNLGGPVNRVGVR